LGLRKFWARTDQFAVSRTIYQRIPFRFFRRRFAA
jgi:hypothetical protein